MKAPVKLKWNDVPAYIDTFYFSAPGTLANIELAPASMTISVAGLSVPIDNEIDVLPLIKMRHADADFVCNFVYADGFDFSRALAFGSLRISEEK